VPALLLLLAASIASSQPALPDSYRVCKSDLECEFAGEGGCCGSYTSVNAASKKAWDAEVQKHFDEHCRGSACPAMVDPTPWTKVPACVAGRCRLRDAASAADCERVFPIYRKNCAKELEPKVYGRCRACLSASCDCPEELAAFDWKRAPESSCRAAASSDGAADRAVREKPALARLCDSAPGPKTRTLSICFTPEGGKTARLARYQQACPGARSRR
jgi:hypothetical protein